VKKSNTKSYSHPINNFVACDIPILVEQ